MSQTAPLFSLITVFFNVSQDDMKKSNIFYRFGNDQILPKNVQLE